MSWKERGRERYSSGRLVAQAEGLNFASHSRVLFEDLTFVLKAGEVTAVTGKGGSGKSTILRIMAGKESNYNGNIRVLTQDIGFLPQNPDTVNISRNKPLVDLFKESLGLDGLEAEITRYNNIIEKDSRAYTQVARPLGEAMQKYQELDGYNAEAIIKKILAGLGVGNIALEKTLSRLSSGQQRRVLLALALFSAPDLLLLDDPTSHIDRSGIAWLTNYLRSTTSAVMIATNHGSFVDGVADQTIGLTDNGRTFVFAGGLSDLISKRDAVLQAEKLKAQQVKGKIDQLEETDQMFRSRNAYKRSSDMAQVGRALKSRIGRLKGEYEEMPGSVNVYNSEKIPDLKFESEYKSGRDVLTIRGVVKSYSRWGSRAVDLTGKRITIQRGEKWLVWGPNGSGKSTLVKTIVDSAKGGSFLPDSGDINIGASVKIAYCTPETESILDYGNIVDSVRNLFPQESQGKIAATLRFFGFQGEQIFRQSIQSLSDGEKKRLNLACAMLEKPNLLILDEPTGDDLSEELKSRLAKAIAKYNGTLILVSHDREFIRKVGINRTLEMPSGKTNLA